MCCFDELYARYFKKVYQICLSRLGKAELALESTQEAFARAWEKLAELRDETKFVPWVSSIAIHYGQKILNGYRRYFYGSADSVPAVPGRLTWEPPTQVDEVNLVRRWILTLEEKDQQLLLLKFYHFRSDAQISVLAGRPLGSVKSRLHGLKALLEKQLQR